MIINKNFINNSNNVSRINPNTGNQSRNSTIPGANGFDKILSERINQNQGIKFSKHAEDRLSSRNINLTEAQKTKINDAVNKASEKGIKDSLIMVDDIAFVVNIKNRTVITAADSKDLKENVFTNIDGAVFS